MTLVIDTLEAVQDRGDGVLLEAWAGGDRDAGAELLDRHYRVLYRFFRNKVPEGIEDLMQQTMMACTRAIGRFRGESTFQLFLLGIARRELLMYYRRRSRKDLPVEPLEESIAGLLDSPSRVAAQRNEQELVAEAMRNIPVDLQITLELYYWEEMKIAEVAEITGVALGTVKSRLSRGRALLRSWLEAQDRVDEALRQSAIVLVTSTLSEP